MDLTLSLLSITEQAVVYKKSSRCLWMRFGKASFYGGLQDFFDT